MRAQTESAVLRLHRVSNPALRLLLVALAASAAAATGCKTEPETAAAKPCCEQPKIPPGVAGFQVVADEVNGPTDGQKVVIRAGLNAPVKRDALFPVLHTLYRHAMQRNSFEPIQFIAEVYASQGDARAGGDPKVIARVERAQGDLAPRCDNRVGYDFGEQVERAFQASLGRAEVEDPADTCKLNEKKKSKRFDDDFKNKATYTLDAAKQAVEVTFPYLVDGKDELRTSKDFTFNSAMTYWIEFTTSLFNKVADLKAITYQGVLADGPAVRIAMTRQQFDEGFARVQESIAAHSALTFQSLGMGKATDASAQKEQETFKKKTYTNALSHLPKGQVTLAKNLK